MKYFAHFFLSLLCKINVAHEPNMEYDAVLFETEHWLASKILACGAWLTTDD